MIESEPLQQIERSYVLWRRRKLSYFSGCDYFRISSHPKVRRALVSGLKRYGLSVAASRRTSGNHVLYARLEKQLASFFNADSALLVPNGYTSNLAAAQALAGQFSHALIDEAAHPSLFDAASLLDCPVLKFCHRSVAEATAALKRCGIGSKPILLTDGMFSRDGSVAPLKEYLKALPRDSVLLVDDAHAAGVLGPNGQGTIELAGVGRRRVIQTVTLSKAIGVYGGTILGSEALRQMILERSRLFIGSTPLPLPLICAAAAALNILGSNKSLRSRIANNTFYLRSLLSAAGLLVPQHPGPIVSLAPRRPTDVPKIKNALAKAAIYPPFIRYPGGPLSGYFRFVISSEHTRAQLDNLGQVLIQIARSLQPLV